MKKTARIDEYRVKKIYEQFSLLDKKDKDLVAQSFVYYLEDTLDEPPLNAFLSYFVTLETRNRKKVINLIWELYAKEQGLLP